MSELRKCPECGHNFLKSETKQRVTLLGEPEIYIICPNPNCGTYLMPSALHVTKPKQEERKE